MRRDPPPHTDPPGGGFLTPPDLLGAQAPPSVDVPVEMAVAPPSIADPRRRVRDQELLTFQMPVQPVATWLFYAVPKAYLFPAPEAARDSHLRPPVRTTTSPAHDATPAAPTSATSQGATTPAATPPAATPTATTAATPPSVATPTPTPAEPPAAAVGSTVYTPDGKAHTVVAATPEAVVTATYTRYAVGAGSTTPLEAGGSHILIDAGTFGLAGEAIAKATLDAIAARVGEGGVIAQILITHAHADHMSLLPRLAERFRIAAIRINALQAERPDFQALMARVRTAHQARVDAEAARVRTELEGERPAWETGDRGDPLTRPQRWAEHSQQRVNAALEHIPTCSSSSSFRVWAAVSRSRRCRSIRAPAPSNHRHAERRHRPRGARTRGGRSGVCRRAARKRRAQHEADRPLLVFMGGGCASDRRAFSSFPISAARIRAPAERLRERGARRRHGSALPGLGRQPSHADRLEQRRHHDRGRTFAARVAARTRQPLPAHLPCRHQGRSGTDVVVVSAYEGFGAHGRSYVDPANVWAAQPRLRGLSRHRRHDVQVLQVITSQRQGGDGAWSARSAEACGRRNNCCGVRSRPRRVARRATPEPGRGRAFKHAGRSQRRGSAGRRDASAHPRHRPAAALEHIHAFQSELGRTTTSTAPPVAPAAGAPEPARAQARALDQRLTAEGFDRPVPTTAARASAKPRAQCAAGPARSERAARQCRCTRVELAEAVSAIRAIEARPADTIDAARNRAELLAELHRYRVALEAQVRQPGATGSSRQLLDDELRTVREHIRTLTPGPETRTLRQRVPGTGALVDTQIVAARRMGRRAPSPCRRPLRWPPRRPTRRRARTTSHRRRSGHRSASARAPRSRVRANADSAR